MEWIPPHLHESKVCRRLVSFCVWWHLVAIMNKVLNSSSTTLVIFMNVICYFPLQFQFNATIHPSIHYLVLPSYLLNMVKTYNLHTGSPGLLYPWIDFLLWGNGANHIHRTTIFYVCYVLVVFNLSSFHFLVIRFFI